MSGYYEKGDVDNWSKLKELAPEELQKFNEYHRSVLSDGKLEKKQKLLIALATAHAHRCPYCIEIYTEECLEHGITKEEMMEAVHVVAMVSAGAVLTHSLQMRKIALEKK